jgi:transglutaminase/protease-like cytokinesis protein 3
MIKSKLSLKFASAVILIVALVIVFASCKKDGGDALKGVEFDEDEIELAVGEEYDLSEILSAKPANVELPKCTYASDDKKVATVGKSNGKVKAVAAGETTVTAETPDGKYSADITVVVSGPKVAVTGITVTPQSLSMRIGETQTLAATVTPAEAADKAVTWSSGAPAVAFVNPATGEVTALSAGPAVITAATRDGDKQAFCTVTVTAATEVSGVSVSPAAATVQKGAAQQFTAAVSGSGNPAQTVTWTVAGAASSGTGVSASGLLTVAAAETASTLTVRATSTADNTKSGTAAVTVGGSAGADYAPQSLPVGCML